MKGSSSGVRRNDANAGPSVQAEHLRPPRPRGSPCRRRSPAAPRAGPACAPPLHPCAGPARFSTTSSSIACPDRRVGEAPERGEAVGLVALDQSSSRPGHRGSSPTMSASSSIERSQASRSVRHGAATTCCTPAASKASPSAGSGRVHALRVPAGPHRDRERSARGGSSRSCARPSPPIGGLVDADRAGNRRRPAARRYAASLPPPTQIGIGCAGLGSTRTSSKSWAAVERHRVVVHARLRRISRTSSMRRPRSWKSWPRAVVLGLRPADADAGDQPTAAQRVELASCVGQLERVVHADDEHARAEPDRRRGRRRPRERQQRVEQVRRRVALRRRVHDVVADPDVGEAELPRRAGRRGGPPRRPPPARTAEGGCRASTRHATTPRTLRSMIWSMSSPRLPRIWSPCSLNSGARFGMAGVPSYCTGAATSSKGLPSAVSSRWTQPVRDRLHVLHRLERVLHHRPLPAEVVEPHSPLGQPAARRTPRGRIVGGLGGVGDEVLVLREALVGGELGPPDHPARVGPVAAGLEAGERDEAAVRAPVRVDERVAGHPAAPRPWPGPREPELLRHRDGGAHRPHGRWPATTRRPTVASPVFSRWKSAPMIPPAMVNAPIESPKAGPGGGGTDSGVLRGDGRARRRAGTRTKSWVVRAPSASGPRSPLPVPRT